MMVDEAEESKQIAEESKEAVVAGVSSASPEAAPTTEEQKQGGAESQAQTRVEQTEHPQIKVSVEVDLVEPIADQVVAEAQPGAESAAAATAQQPVVEGAQNAESSADVEMTDENR